MSRFLALFFVGFCAFSQDQHTATPTEQSKKVLNLFIDRVGFLRDVNYGYIEWFQIRSTKHPKWSVIFPDVGMIFFDNIRRYREVFIGAGFEVRPIQELTIAHEAYFAQATGIDGHGKTYYQPWTRVEYQFPKQFTFETVAFPYIPLNSGTTQFVWERSKLQYTGFKRFNVGGGYGAYKDFTYTRFQSKPFGLVTLKTKSMGNFEFWVQAMPGRTFQIQYRHAISWHSRR